MSGFQIEFAGGVRPVSEATWMCPLYIKTPGQKFSHFIADVVARTPVEAAARAAALGQMIILGLERQLNPPTAKWAFRGDALAFAKCFEIELKQPELPASRDIQAEPASPINPDRE